MVLEIILNLVLTVLEHTVGPVIRHASYAFCYSRKVAELNIQVGTLATTRESLQNSVGAAERRGDEIQPDTEIWVTEAENAIKEAGEVTQRKEEEGKKKCFAGGCPNLRTRYHLGKKAAKKALAIEALAGRRPDPSHIAYRALPQQIVSSSVHGFEDWPSRASNFKEVMDALSDTKFNRIGVHGMGGTGKSTLAKEVHKQAIEGNLFDVVAMATLSEKPDLKEIQGRIADVLGLKLEEETIDGRADRLRQRLMNENMVLIILDNLWEKIDLEKLGIPLTNEKSIEGRGADSVPEGLQFNSQLEPTGRNKNFLKEFKLLMISRNRQLLTNDMGVQKEVMLNVLTEEESYTLFEKTVGGLKIPSLQPIAKEVARKCAGLPLLLVTMSSALKDKGLGDWKDALNRLSTFEDEEIHNKVYTCLEWSYDRLPTEEVKSFFLLCGLFSYARISILDLLKYSMGLGLLRHVHTVQDARNRVDRLIETLKVQNLLLDSETDGHVKIHDVVQDVAASIASRAQLAFKKVGGEMEEFKRKDTTSYARIYLDNCDVSMLNLKLQCPAVESFHLNAKGLSLKIPDSFFEGITKLQVLNFTGMHFSSLPLSLGSLTSLCTLCLDFCKLKDISIITQLKNLEILSLMGSEIVDLPRDFAELTRLKLLDLSDCTKLEFIPENVLLRLSRLEELLLHKSFANWEIKQLDGQTNASLSELERLPLTNLEIHVPDAKKLPKSMSSKKLERYNILVGDTWDWDDKYRASRTLKLKLDTSIHSKYGLKILLNDVEDLFLDEVKGITNILFELHREGFPQLKRLHVRNGGEILHIIDKRWVACAAFPALESLILHNLVNLSKISRKKLLDEDLRKLRILKARRCNGLKNLFPLSMVRINLRQLGEMEIVDCSDMEAIFADENEEEIEEDDDKNEVLEFAQLYSLKLLQLPLLRSFCSKGKASTSTSTSRSRQKQFAMDPPLMEIETASDTSVPLFNEMIVFPNLEELELSSIGADKIWHGQFADRHSFYKLTSLTVKTCRNFNYLCTTSIVKSLAQLQKLEIHDCGSMEDVIATNGEKLDKTAFPNLEFLKLRGLPKLSRFCVGDSIEFPSLKELWIKDCVELRAFISDPVAVNTRSNLVLFDKKIIFPNLQELELSSIGVDKIWHEQFADRHSFCKLTSLTVEACRNLNYLCPTSIVKSLVKLEIRDCGSMEDIIAMDGKKLDETGFPNLEFLKLRGLPKFSRFCVDGLIEFASLKKLWIEDCVELKAFVSNPVAVNTRSNLALFDEKVLFPKLEELRIVNMNEIKMIWHDELHKSSFCKLKSIIIEHAEELLNVFPSNMLFSRLLNLENLLVNDCPLLGEVFNLQLQKPINFKIQGFTTSQLKKLTIKNLLNLKCIWNKHLHEREIIFFNNLQEVEAYQCPNLKSFFPAFIARGLLQLKSLHLVNCGTEDIVERDEETEAIARFEFPKLTALLLYNLTELKTVYAGMHTSEWPMLKKLGIFKCPKMQVFTSEDESIQETCQGSQLDNSLQQPFFSVKKVMPNMEVLSLACKDAQMIWDAQFPTHFFDKVRLLRLTELDKKSASFLFDLLRRFHNLEALTIFGGGLEEMLSCEGSVNGENQGSIVPRIRRMTLDMLYNMRSIWRRDCQMEHMLEDLEILQLWRCNSLLSLAPSVACFGNLSHLYVWKCNGLLNLVTSSTVKYMGRLTKLSIRECEMVEEIVAREEKDREGQIAWDNLKILTLHCLASLTCFSSAHHTFQFPSLEEVIVTQCPKLKAFSGGVSITPKLKIVKLTEEDAEGRWKGDLNTTIQQLSAELVGLHGREHLKLSDFPELKETWHKEHFPPNSLSDLRSLVVDECLYYSYAVPSNLLRSLDKLAELEVKNCDSVEEVFDLTLPYAADGQMEALPKLKKLQLIDLPRLKQVWKEEPQWVFHLRNLKVLKIHYCSTLRYLFTPTTCLGLVRLRELEVKSCPLIEEIITKGAASGSTADNLMFPLLNSVSLESLPNLASFYSGSGAFQCPLLKNIAIIECSNTFSSEFLNGHPTFNTNGAIQAKVVFPNLEELKLSSIRVENMWWGQFVDRSSLFSRLTNLEVEGCGNLNYLLSPSAVKSLSELQKLEICDCEIMEEIVLAEGDMLRKILFPKLEFLRLKGLPKLLRFCIGDLIEFPYLKELWIENCVELKTFISDHFTTSTAVILALFDGKVVLPMLKTLQVLNLDRLKMIWHNELHKESFCKLKNLTVKHCRELSKIFPSIMLTRFQDLEQLDVRDCDSLEEVFNLQVLMDLEETRAERVTQLRTVHLGNLPNLKHIWKENSQRDISFQSLRLAHVWDCPVLKSIFPASVAEVLLQLEDLNIDSCGVEEIVAAEEGEGKESQITRFMFPKLNSLTLWKLSKLDKFYPEIHTTEWPALKTLNVKECDKMKIFSFESQSLQGPWEEEQPDIQVPQPLFSFQEVIPGLEELSLNNEDAAIIWKSQFPANLFDKLEALQLNCFHDKSTVFPFEILHRFHNVEKLIVACSQFKELFASEELFDKEEHKRALAQIRHLKLDCLPNLEHIWNQEPQLDHVLPSLKALEVFNCDNLRNLAPSFTSFQSLTTLEMKKCHGLINIVASSTAKTLVQLKTMRIIGCNMVREIVASDGGKTDEEIMFRRLVTLELNCLPSLASFCSANHSFKFPSLKKVIVSQCPKMELFSKVALSTPKLERVKRTEDDLNGCWHRNLNVTIQQFFGQS